MYVKFNPRWLPFPNTSTPITDKALDHIEQGITDVDITRDGTPAEVALSSRLSATAGSAEGLVQAERAAREAALALKADSAEMIDALGLKANASAVYTKAQSDTALALKANADAVYTKAQVDAAVSPKANSVDVYTKAQSDTALGLKANKADVYTKAETYSRAETGTQITNAITASRPPLYGTGFPNGVVAAPVGTLYADTAVTNGASLWQKVSGTGNTGWVAVAGGTGRRNIASLIAAGLEVDRAHIERTASTLTLRITVKPLSTAVVDVLADSILPPEWRPSTFEFVTAIGDDGTARRLVFTPTGRIYIEAGQRLGWVSATAAMTPPTAYPAAMVGTN